MKIMVVGQSVEDFIKYNDRFEHKPGGIFYSTAGLTFLKDDDDEILLSTSISKEKLSLFSWVYDLVNSKNFDYVDAIPTIHLNIVEGSERHEKYENITDKINLKLNASDKPDGILINMITGFDISIEDLQNIRKTFNAPVYMDLHTLCRGVGEGYKRHFRQIPDFDKWAACVDFIQCNDSEIFTASSKKDERDIAFEVLNFGPKALLVTKGELGARLYSLKNGELVSVFIPALKVEAVNKVGCGDLFGAGFFYTYLKTQDVIKALKYGNIAGAVIATYKDITNLKNIKNDILSRYN